MESRNMITAREMVYDGNWLVPTMNGDLRLEKPPLPTWITAIAEMVSPDNVFLQRAMAGLAAVMLVVYFYLVAVEIMKSKRYAFLSSILLCTCYNIILMGRTASWDIYCHAFMMGAIYYLIKAFSSSGSPEGVSAVGGAYGAFFYEQGACCFLCPSFAFSALLLLYLSSGDERKVEHGGDDGCRLCSGRLLVVCIYLFVSWRRDGLCGR